MILKIIAQHRHCGTTTIQLCDRLEPGAHRRVRAALPDVKLIQVVQVIGDESVEEART